MLFYGYMSRIACVLPLLEDLKEENIKLLCLFVIKPHLSIYQVYKIFEEEGKKIAYKNVHKKVQRLIDLKLIERVTDTSNFKERELDRGAKYYKLSEEGIFAIFDNPASTFKIDTAAIEKDYEDEKYKDISKVSNTIFKIDKFEEIALTKVIDIRNEIYKYHKDCNFFKFFLFPWISINTIESVHPHIINKINNHLSECCRLVKDVSSIFIAGVFNPMEKLNFLFGLDELVVVNGMKTNSLENGINIVDEINPVFNFMIKVFPLEPGQSVLVNRQKNNNNHIEISELDGSKLFTILFDEKQKELEIISSTDNNDRISLPGYSMDSVGIPHPLFEYEITKIDLSLSYFKAVFSIMIEDLIEDDLKILYKDSKFVDTLSKLDNRFHNNYNKLKR